MEKSRFTGNRGGGTTMSAEMLDLDLNCAATFHRKTLHNPCVG